MQFPLPVLCQPRHDSRKRRHTYPTGRNRPHGYEPTSFFGKRGGVTFSGGEPTFQAKALVPLVRELKEKGIHVCIDSNGGIWNEEVEELFKLTDLVLLDIKEFNPARHQALTGRSNEQTIRTAAWLEENEKPFWLRYVLVPGYSDFEEDIRRLGEALGKYKMVQRVEILPYHTLGVHKYEAMEQEYKLKDVKENTPNNLKKLRRYLKSISLLWWSINHHSNK